MLYAPLPAGPRRFFCVLPLALALAACGGGGSGTADPLVPEPGTPLTISGTAATGAAIAGGAVSIKCRVGTATATTNPNGTFSASLPAAALPCLLKVSSGSTVLHSLATGTGATAKANITPVTELVVARVAGAAPASYFSGFDATAAAALTADKASAAVTAVVGQLKNVGVDFTAAGVGDVLTGDLSAANGSTPGNALDQALDTLNAELAKNGTTLAALADAVAKVSTGDTSQPTPVPTGALSNTPSLPANLLLLPAAPNCSALRSGKYRVVINRNRPQSGSHDTEVVTIDAPALKVTNADGSINQLVDNGACRYKDLADNSELVVSPAGVVVFQAGDGGSFRLGLAFPEQTHPLSAGAGEWNSLQLERTEDSGPIILTNATYTLDAAGTLTAATFCENGLPCESGTLGMAGFPQLSTSVNSSGGFNLTDGSGTSGGVERVFWYRSGGGELLGVTLSDAGGHLGLRTRKAPSTLPEAGRVSSFWSMTQNNNYTASGVSENKNTIRSVDATANSLLRDAVINLSTNITRPETIRINTPRDGFSMRVGETVTASDGSSSPVSAFILLALRGTGISAVGIPGNNTLVLSVSK